MQRLHDTQRVLDEVLEERKRQHAKWGEQNCPDGTSDDFKCVARLAREECDREHQAGRVTYRHILNEEVAEAFAEVEPAKLREELIQVAAVCVSWIEAIDRRNSR